MDFLHVNEGANDIGANVKLAMDQALSAAKEASERLHSQVNEVLARCTPGKLLVTVLLFVSICAWTVAFQKIEEAAHHAECAYLDSPRTVWSTKRTGQLDKWRDFQQQLASVAAAYEPATPYDARSRLVLLGDSITESWSGTSYGERIERAAAIPSVLDDTLGRRWPRPMVLGISGDQTQHVLYRLGPKGGELVSAMRTDPRLLVVLLIGTNNLAAGHTPEDVVAGIGKIARRLLNGTRGRLLVNMLLPRGDGMRVLSHICPPRCAKDGAPFSSFRPLIDRTNELLERSMPALATAFPERVRLIDCSQPFFNPRYASSVEGAKADAQERSGDDAEDAHTGALRGLVSGTASSLASWSRGGLVSRAVNWSRSRSADNEEVRLDYMPDRLHPNAAGSRVWAGCIEEEITIAQWDAVHQRRMSQRGRGGSGQRPARAHT